MLGGLRFQLTRCFDIGQQGQVHKDTLATRALLAELTDRLKKRQALDIADRAADFAQHEIHFILADGDEIFDLIGDVGNHLDGFA